MDKSLEKFAAKNALNKQIAEQNRLKSISNKEAESFKTNINELKTRISTLTSTLESYEDSVSNIKSKLTEIETTNSSFEDRIASLEESRDIEAPQPDDDVEMTPQ